MTAQHSDHAFHAPGSEDRSLFHGLLALLVWLPLPLASNRPWAMAIMQLWVLVLFALWLARAGAGRLLVTRSVRIARWLLGLFGIWIIYGLLQLVALPMPVVSALSPVAAALDRSVLVGAVTFIPIALDVQAGLVVWFQTICYVLLFVLLLLLVRSRRRVRRLAWVLIAAAVLQATLASLVALTGVDLWFIERASAAHGTYPNRNHLAGFLEMNLALGIGLLIAESTPVRPGRSWRQRLRDWSRILLGPTTRIRIGLAIMVVALVLTASRMGNIAFFASLLIVGLPALFFFRRSPRPVLILLISLLCVDLLILGSWFGLDRVRERIERTVIAEEIRYDTNLDAADYLSDFLLVGSGGGSFYSVYLGYQEQMTARRFMRHAHNDYLEFLLELGLVGGILLAGILLLSIAAAVVVLLRSGDRLAKGMSFATLMGVTALLIHSTADFNLRIPANVALFLVLLALPWIGLALTRDEPRRDA